MNPARVWLLLPRLKRSALLLLPVLVVSLFAGLVQWNPRLRPRSTWTESDLVKIARNTWHDRAKRCRVIHVGPKLPGEELFRQPTFTDLVEVLEARGRTPATERVLAETLRHGTDAAIRDLLPLAKDWQFDHAVPLMIARLKDRIELGIESEYLEPTLDSARLLVELAPADPRVQRELASFHRRIKRRMRDLDLEPWAAGVVQALIVECESHGPPRSR